MTHPIVELNRAHFIDLAAVFSISDDSISFNFKSSVNRFVSLVRLDNCFGLDNTLDLLMILLLTSKRLVKLIGFHHTSSKMIHLQINHHYIKEIVASKDVLPVYCPTDNMVADIMTKALPKAAFVKLRDILLNGL